MKKELIIATVLAATSVFALESNSVSFLPVSNPPSTTQDGKNLMLLSLPFKGYGSDSVNVADVLVTDTLSAGDVLYVPTATKGTYDQYTLASGKASWTPGKKVTINASGVPVAGSSDSATEATIPRGQPFWLKTAATNVKLLGELPTQTKTSVTVTTDNNGYKLVAPTTTEQVITLGSLKEAAGTGDLIILANGTRYQKVSSGWKLMPARTAASDDIVISAGTGFWYKANNAARTLSL